MLMQGRWAARSKQCCMQEIAGYLAAPDLPVLRTFRFLLSVSVALPEWFFSKDKQTAPLILLVLLFGGIVAPLGIAAWYLMGTQK